MHFGSCFLFVVAVCDELYYINFAGNQRPSRSVARFDDTQQACLQAAGGGVMNVGGSKCPVDRGSVFFHGFGAISNLLGNFF